MYLFGTFLVVGVAIGVNLLYERGGRRRFTNVERTRRISEEVKAFNNELREAMKANNTAKVEELRRKQKQMMVLQQRVARESLKPSLMFAVPLLGLWFVLNSFVFMPSIVLAHSPTIIPLIFTTIPAMLPFYWWYLIAPSLSAE